MCLFVCVKCVVCGAFLFVLCFFDPTPRVACVRDGRVGVAVVWLLYFASYIFAKYSKLFFAFL